METRHERDRDLKWQRLLVVIGIFLFFAYETNAFATTVYADESHLIVQHTESRLQVVQMLTEQQIAIEALKPPMCVPQ